MQYVLDAILAVVLVFITVRGYIKGFFKSILSAGKIILAILLTVLLGARVSSWLDQRFINPPVLDAIRGKLSAMATEAGSQSDEFCQQLVDKYGSYIDAAALEEQVKNGSESLDTLADRYAVSISGTVSGAISTVVGYLLTFLVAFLVLSLLSLLVGLLTSLPVLKQCDKLAGLGLGLLSGFLTVCLLATVMWALLYATNSISIYEKTHLLKFFKELKLFQFILDKIL